MKNFIIISLMLMLGASVYAENIDPQNTDNQYAWGENVGWLNFEPTSADPNAGATVSMDKVTGYIWAENIGWINLSPDVYGGVSNDGYGNLSGYAWAENVGWIDFDPNYGGKSYGVKIDTNGNFSGWAYGENIGWINFKSNELFDQGVRVCVVNYLHLKTMAEQWLNSGGTADLYEDRNINFRDFEILASYWMDYCPDGWSL